MMLGYRMDLLVYMKDLMVNKMDFVANISMMENILVMVHASSSQAMMVNNVDLMENNQVMTENILDLSGNMMEMMENNLDLLDYISVMYDKFLDLHYFDYLKMGFELNMLVMLVNKNDLVNMMEMLDYMMDLLENNKEMLNLVFHQ